MKRTAEPTHTPGSVSLRAEQLASEAGVPVEIAEIYLERLDAARPERRGGGFVMGTVMLLAFGAWAVWLLSRGAYGWALIPGMIALGGVQALVDARSRRRTR